MAKKKVAKKKKSDNAARIKAGSENIQYAEFVTADVMEFLSSLTQGLDQLDKSNQSLNEQIAKQQAALQSKQSETESWNIQAVESLTAEVMERLNSLKQGLDQLDSSNQTLTKQIALHAASQREQSEIESESIKTAESVTVEVVERLNSLKHGLDQLERSNQKLTEQIAQQQAALQHERSETESGNIQAVESVTVEVVERLNGIKQGLDQLDSSNQSLTKQIVKHQAASRLQSPLFKIIILLLGISIITIGYSSLKINSRMNEATGVDSDDMNSYEIGYAFGIKMAKLLPGINLNEMVSGMCDILSEVDTSLINAGVCPDQSATADNQVQADTIALPPLPTPPGAFMEDVAAPNTMSQGVTTLPSGVQYEVLKAGSGTQPQAGDDVLISYQTYLDDGSIFGTTGNDGESRRISLDEIKVPGLKEALLLMNEGARWRVVIPPNMGFTKSGNRTLRRSNLTYDIELISVEQG